MYFQNSATSRKQEQECGSTSVKGRAVVFIPQMTPLAQSCASATWENNWFAMYWSASRHYSALQILPCILMPLLLSRHTVANAYVTLVFLFVSDLKRVNTLF